MILRLNKPLSSRGVMMSNNQVEMMMTVKRKVKVKVTRKVEVKALLLCVLAEVGPLKEPKNLALMIND